MQLDYSWTPAQIEKRAARDSLAALSRMGGRYASVPPYNDEPKVVNLTVTFPGALEGRGLGRASGSSLEFDRAAAKVFGEAVERVSALPPADIEAVPRLRYEDLDEDAMDPQLLFTSCRGVRPTREDSIRWMEGLRVGRSGQAKSLVPAKLVYLPYEVADEPIWFLSTSNGLAAGSSPEHAAYAGLLELVERDALMRFWTNPETAAFLPVEAMNDDRLVALCSLAARYGLRPDLVLLSVPFPSVAVVLCYVADTTGYGPHGSIGLKAAGSISEAAFGALEEGIQLRPWLREIAESHELPVPTLRTIDDRARWWLTPEALYEWTSRHSQVTRTVPPVVDSTLLSLGDLVESVSEQAGDLWVVPLQSAASDLSVTRVFAPGIAPVYFDEEYAIRSTSSDFFSIELRHPLL